MSRTLKRALAENGIKNFRTDYRVKGLYSLARKLARKGGDVEKIYDIAALRVIVGDISDCYRVLGIANSLWQPLPNKIKDYIAFPKPNGYQSLHTTVFSGDGSIVEIQIRTQTMHQEAEHGIAAHVAYKEGDVPAPSKGGSPPAGGRGASGGSFDWIKSLLPGFARRPVRQSLGDGVSQKGGNDNPKEGRSRYGGGAGPEWLTELPDETEDPDFETTLRTDIFSRRVFIFTPKGDVVDLPADCSPIDFAYAIHSDVGDHVFAAKVNGKLVPLDTMLRNGDIVEIQTRKSAYPTKKWLDFAKTTLARRHIRNALEKQSASAAAAAVPKRKK